MNRIYAYGCCLALAAGSFYAMAAAKGDAAKGKQVFDANCAVCHNADNTEKKMGPGLKGLFKRAKLANGKSVSDATVLEQINAGGNGMPPYKDLLTDTQKDDLMAYLKTL